MLRHEHVHDSRSTRSFRKTARGYFKAGVGHETLNLIGTGLGHVEMALTRYAYFSLRGGALIVPGVGSRRIVICK